MNIIFFEDKLWQIWPLSRPMDSIGYSESYVLVSWFKPLKDILWPEVREEESAKNITNKYQHQRMIGWFSCQYEYNVMK